MHDPATCYDCVDRDHELLSGEEVGDLMWVAKEVQSLVKAVHEENETLRKQLGHADSALRKLHAATRDVIDGQAMVVLRSANDAIAKVFEAEKAREG